MKSLWNKTVVAAAIAWAPLAAMAGPVGLDGTLGTEWTGISASAHVLFDASAAEHNFGAPTNKSNNSAYDIYMRTDSQYLYVGLQQLGSPVTPQLFANLYFALVWGGGTQSSQIGFETGNDQAFHPQVTPGPKFSDTAADLLQTVATANMIEVAIDLSVFTQNALGVTGFTGLPTGQTADGIVMTLSQSFGYSVAGGTAAYGPRYLGAVAIPQAAELPEPASLALAGLALAGAAALTRRRRNQA